jgi:hypothetical protein
MAITLLAEFADADGAVAAAKRLRDNGYEGLEAYTPYPVVELEDALRVPRSRIPLFTLLAGMSGAAGALGLIEWMNAFDYPLDVGGRPLHSIPASVPIMFEGCILAAATTTFLAALLFAGMPRLHDPVFEVEGFDRTTTDRYWITVSLRRGVRPDVARFRDDLDGLGALRLEAIGADGAPLAAEAAS